MPAPRLLHVFATFAAGGPQVRTARLMNALGDEFRHAVMAMDGHTEARELVESHVDLELLTAPEKRGSLATGRELRRRLPEIEQDVLLTYNWGSMDAVLAGRRLGLSAHVHHEDGFLPDEARRFKQRRVWMRRLFLRRVKSLIVPSMNLRDIALGVWHLPEPLVHWIPNGIRVEDFLGPDTDAGRQARAELRQRYGVPASARVVGSVGHLRGEKNLLRLLDAAASLEPDVHVLIVGDGAERTRLEERAAERDLAGRVHFTGHLGDLGRVYAAMDVFAMSSDTEQMPVALLEAMSAGLPAAATDVGDIARILPPEQAAFVTPLGRGGPDAAAALGEALARLLATPDAGREFGAGNLARVREAFTFEVMVDAYRERYLHAL